MTLSALILSAALAAGSPAADIHVAVNNIDLGTTLQGEILSMKYEVENRGDAPLEIKVKASCGCTVAEAPDAIPAGESGFITATIDTAKFTGPITKSLTVTSNDPDTPVMRLIATAIIDPVVAVSPSKLIRFDMIGGTVAEQTVRLSATRGGVLEVDGVGSKVPFVQARLKKVEDGVVEITVIVDETAPVGLLNIPLSVNLGAGLAPIELKVAGVVRAAN